MKDQNNRPFEIITESSRLDQNTDAEASAGRLPAAYEALMREAALHEGVNLQDVQAQMLQLVDLHGRLQQVLKEVQSVLVR